MGLDISISFSYPLLHWLLWQPTSPCLLDSEENLNSDIGLRKGWASTDEDDLLQEWEEKKLNKIKFHIQL